MPEQDFELYLSLLSRFLRLKSAQRVEIADELRDHLEARLEELAARGLTRDEAIRAALDEFGDAAELANHFTQVAHIRNRRLIMRVTFGTITALAASLLVATAFWPESRQAPVPALVIAQESPKGAPPKNRPQPAPDAVEDEKAVTEAKLSRQLAKIPDELSNAPLADAMNFLGQLLDLDIVLDQAALSEVELQTSVINVKRTKLTGRAALDLLLEPLNLSYTIRDGLIMVTSAEKANQIHVYNVRDLLPNLGEHVGPGSMASSPGAPGTAAGPGAGGGTATMMRGMGGRGMGGGLGGGMGGTMGGGTGGGMTVRETNSLAVLIAATIDPDSWELGGGNGSVIQYHELLVVKNSQTVHSKVKALLEMLRTCAKSPFGAAPPGGPVPAVR